MIIIEPGAIKTEFGDVLMGPMLERSGDATYADLAQKVAKLTNSGKCRQMSLFLVKSALDHVEHATLLFDLAPV